MHFWQLKTFWHETKVWPNMNIMGATLLSVLLLLSYLVSPYHDNHHIDTPLLSAWQVCMDDIEYHSYEEIETHAAFLSSHHDPLIRMVVQEMLEFKRKVCRMYISICALMLARVFGCSSKRCEGSRQSSTTWHPFGFVKRGSLCWRCYWPRRQTDHNHRGSIVALIWRWEGHRYWTIRSGRLECNNTM